MRSRLTASIVAVVIGTLVVTAAGSLFFIRRNDISTTSQRLAQQTQPIVKDLENPPPGAASLGAAPYLDLLSSISDIKLSLIGLRTLNDTFTLRLPSPLTSEAVDVPALLGRHSVHGNIGSVVYYLRPVRLTTQQLTLAHARPDDVGILVATKNANTPINGLRYFLLVAVVALAVAALVAAALARRISAPLRLAVATTREIAGGTLSAKVPVDKSDGQELAELAVAINTMGDSLEQARNAERQFLLSVSHDLRTPLTSIRGYAEALVDGATDDIAGAAGVISTEARRLERLVGDLLDLARLDTKRFSLDLRPVDAAEVVSDVAEAFRPQGTAAGLELIVTIPEAVGPWVNADPDRLGQVVNNLVENAFKFAGKRVEVGAGPSGSMYALWVMDDGPGIPPEDLPHVFERHYTSDRGSPGKRPGSGLGLAIVSELADAMGASVRAESPVTDGHGTRIVVWFHPSDDS